MSERKKIHEAFLKANPSAKISEILTHRRGWHEVHTDGGIYTTRYGKGFTKIGTDEESDHAHMDSKGRLTSGKTKEEDGLHDHTTKDNEPVSMADDSSKHTHQEQSGGRTSEPVKTAASYGRFIRRVKRYSERGGGVAPEIVKGLHERRQSKKKEASMEKIAKGFVKQAIKVRTVSDAVIKAVESLNTHQQKQLFDRFSLGDTAPRNKAMMLLSPFMSPGPKKSRLKSGLKVIDIIQRARGKR